MKLIFVPSVVAILAMATSGYSQERSAGGTQEVQSSFSALKLAISNAQGTADGAVIDAAQASKLAQKGFNKAVSASEVADAAQTDATSALKLATAIKTCTTKQKFYDPSNSNADRSTGCVAAIDDGNGTGFRANVDSFDFDDADQTVNLGKQYYMMIDVSCNVKFDPTQATYISRDWYSCGTGKTKTKNWSVAFGKSGSNANVVAANGSKSYKSAQGTYEDPVSCGGASFPVAVSFYTHDKMIYKGQVVLTPDGTRVVGMTPVISVDNWDGTLTVKNCEGKASATYYSVPE
jgi:hypothetical protein